MKKEVERFRFNDFKNNDKLRQMNQLDSFRIVYNGELDVDLFKTIYDFVSKLKNKKIDMEISYNLVLKNPNELKNIKNYMSLLSINKLIISYPRNEFNSIFGLALDLSSDEFLKDCHEFEIAKAKEVVSFMINTKDFK